MRAKSNFLYELLLCLLLSGCAGTPTAIPDPFPAAAEDAISLKVVKESEKLAQDMKILNDLLEKKAVKILDIEPVMPVYNPLDDHTVSFSMIDEDFQVVLFSLAKAVGMNLILDPEFSVEKRLITLNFDHVPASTILNEILKSFDLYYEIDQNVIRIKQMEERFFKLNFLDTSLTSSFNVGGDVLGVGDVSTGGLTGSFNISGESSKSGNVYDLVEEMLKRVKSPKGKYSLNRISGSLYVKDTPAVLQSIAAMINRLKETLGRQILIEARIIEVSLSDGYKFGVDWRYLRDSLAQSTKLDNISWRLDAGLVINEGTAKGVSTLSTANSFSAVINALKTFGNAKIVSNPSVRAKHGQPAMISVGTSFTYKESVETTTTNYSGATSNQYTTQVETSTVFDGLILGVISFIDDDGMITLLINPIKSDVDPASLEPEALGGGDSISLPKVSIKEISTTINLHDKDVVVLGGLIDRRRITKQEGLPLLSRIPFLGQLFRKDFETQEARELVIVLKVSLI